MRLIKKQQVLAEGHFNKRIFLEGVSGTGKTTVGIERAKSLIKQGVPADSILLIVPQVSFGNSYRESLRRSRLKANYHISIATFGSLAQQTVDLFFPLVAETLGFENPVKRPHFLSLELVQYYMKRFIEPEIERNDYFNSVHIDRNRLYTQIVDNLNKSALVGFSHFAIAERLKSAQLNDVEQAYIYDDAQTCAEIFREICRHYNLLDFSLQAVIFTDFLWQNSISRQYLTQKYRHLIVDNLEENSPKLHDILRDWLPLCESALIIYDSEGGYRRFLGADPYTALELKAHCDLHETLEKQRIMSDSVLAFSEVMAKQLQNKPISSTFPHEKFLEGIAYSDSRYHSQMLRDAVKRISHLVHEEGVSPNEIVVVSAYVPDAMLFELEMGLKGEGIRMRSHRPSRSLRENPITRLLITWAKVAHPEWKKTPSPLEIAFALKGSLIGCDLVRARLMAECLYSQGKLLPFNSIRETDIQERITFELGNSYERLRQWIETYQTNSPLELDIFFSKLFGEVLSQPRYQLHNNLEGASKIANMVDSAREFRRTISLIEEGLPISKEYIAMVDAGVIGNLYERDWQNESENSVLVAPAYTYLMTNRPVSYQFWLNIGSSGWGQRLYQPLTHPHVLSRQWEIGRIWTDEDEQIANQQALYELALGLIRRCRKQIYLGFSTYGEQGFEQRGALLMAFQNLLRHVTQKRMGNV